jgi:hypothetical protein
MSHPIRAWNKFWFRPISARPLGAFRVLIGLLTLGHLGLLSLDLDYWLTDHGLMMGSESRDLAGSLRFSPLQWVQDPASVHAFFVVTVAVAVLFTVGWRTRLMGFLLYPAVLSIHHRNIATNCGPDNLLVALLFYLMLSPCGAAYSLDALRASRKRGTLAEPLIVPWAQRLIQLQLVLVYLNTAVLKCNGSTWLGGTVMHYVLNNPEVRRFDVSFLCQYPALLNAMSHAVLALEFALPFLIWFKPTRGWVIAGGLALHVGVLFLINVPLFGELMTACYLTFLTPDEFDALARTLNPFRGMRPGRPTSSPLPGRADAPERPRGPHTPVVAPILERVVDDA